MADHVNAADDASLSDTTGYHATHIYEIVYPDDV